jgi:hypothetical protein
LSEQQARCDLACRVGQNRRDLADQTRIVLADIDLDPNETPSRQTRAVTYQCGFGTAARGYRQRGRG